MKDNWTNQKPRIATEEDVKARWSGEPNGKRFRCHLCGYKFQVGDYWRFVMATHLGYTNFKTCKNCDGEDILERWKKHNEEYYQKYWWKD